MKKGGSENGNNLLKAQCKKKNAQKQFQIFHRWCATFFHY
jgi:hypothetical protein